MSVSRKSTTLTIPGPVICQVEGYIQYIQHHINTNRTLADYLAIEEQKQIHVSSRPKYCVSLLQFSHALVTHSAEVVVN